MGGWRRWIIVGGAGLLGVGAAVGLAAGEDSLHACINKRSGVVREAGAAGCSKSEIAIEMTGSAKSKGGTLTINGVAFKRTGTLPNSITINGNSFRSGTLPQSLTINGNSFKGGKGKTLTINGTPFKSGSRGGTLTINGVAFKKGSGGTLTINGTAFAGDSSGAQGPQGATGPQGPPGPSHAYSVSGALTPAQGVVDQTLAVPAGTYAVTGTADVTNTSAARTVTCRLATAGTDFDTGATDLGDAAAGGGAPVTRNGSLALQGTATLASAGNLTLHCDGGAGLGLAFPDVDIVAVKVEGAN